MACKPTRRGGVSASDTGARHAASAPTRSDARNYTRNTRGNYPIQTTLFWVASNGIKQLTSISHSPQGRRSYPVVTALYLIEDHLMVREGLRAMLTTARNQVVGESSDPARAIADLLLLQPDVVLLDLALGGRSGMEILAEVKRRALRSRCIVLTMSSSVRDVAQALRLGAWGYVLKTAPILEVTKAIESVVQGRRYLGSSVSELAAEALLHQVPEAQLLDALSARERQIALLVVQGHSSSEIGALLHLSAKTVDTYRSRLMSKLGVRDVPALVRLAIRMGMIGADR